MSARSRPVGARIAGAERLARDREYVGLSRDRLSFAIPGYAQPVRVFGLCGGDGAWCTVDGWTVAIIHPLWPRPWLILRPPVGAGAQGLLHGASRLDLKGLDEHDWLRVGLFGKEGFVSHE